MIYLQELCLRNLCSMQMIKDNWLQYVCLMLVFIDLKANLLNAQCSGSMRKELSAQKHTDERGITNKWISQEIVERKIMFQNAGLTQEPVGDDFGHTGGGYLVKCRPMICLMPKPKSEIQGVGVHSFVVRHLGEGGLSIY